MLMPRALLSRLTAPSCACSPEGTYQDQAAQTSCIPCPPGTWAGSSGADACDPVPAGAYTNTTGSSTLTWCGPDTISSANGTTCVACPQGSSRDSDASPDSNGCYQTPSSS